MVVGHPEESSTEAPREPVLDQQGRARAGRFQTLSPVLVGRQPGKRRREGIAMAWTPGANTTGVGTVEGEGSQDAMLLGQGISGEAGVGPAGGKSTTPGECRGFLAELLLWSGLPYWVAQGSSCPELESWGLIYCCIIWAGNCSLASVSAMRSYPPQSRPCRVYSGYSIHCNSDRVVTTEAAL